MIHVCKINQAVPVKITLDITIGKDDKGTFTNVEAEASMALMSEEYLISIAKLNGPWSQEVLDLAAELARLIQMEVEEGLDHNPRADEQATLSIG